MSIANVLIRPQVLDRRPTDDEAVALDLLTSLGSRLAIDFAQGGPASVKIVAATQSGANHFISQFQSRLQTARTKLLEWLDPYLSLIEGVTDGLGNDSTENLIAVATALLALTDKLLTDLHSANLADRLNSLGDILEEDLGLSWNTFEEFFDSIFDSVVNALSTDLLKGSQSDEAVNNFLISRQLLTLRRVAKEQLARVPLPTFDRRAVVREWQLELEASNWDETLDAIQEKLKAGPAQISKILQLINKGVSVNVDVNVSISGKSLRDTSAPGQYSWYGSWFRGEGTGVRDRFNIAGESFAGEIHFTDALSAKFLEHWALVTAALEEAARAVKYGVDIDAGNKVTPALNLGWQSAMGVMTLLSYLVEGEEWVTFYSVKNHTAFQMGVPLLLTLGGSFEQYPGFWGWLWGTMPHDVGNMFSGRSWPKLIREGLLSLFTLINADDSANTKNHQKIAGIKSASRTGGAYIASLVMGRKDLYYSIPTDSFGLSVLVLLGGAGITWAFDITGWLISAAIARRFSDRYWTCDSASEFVAGDNVVGGLVWSFIDFYFTWGGFWEGKTRDGKFGMKAKFVAHDDIARTEVSFNGYPAKASSPYLLPFEPGRLVFCSQGHNGFSGNNFRKGLVYAADFLLNEGELVLAMRDGTVIDYNDTRRNGSDDGTNYIVIRHDTLDAVHDLGEGGQPIITYARYEHSSPFGIRQAFAVMGIPETRIIGAKVQAGFPLMRVGKRPGFFNFDFLKVQVFAAAADGVLPTIPFVFRDVPDGGVPKKGKYYTSGNTLKAPGDLSLLHVGQAVGWVEESGVDFIKLQPTASEADDAYKDAHVFVSYNLNGCNPWYEYRKIKSYKGGKRKLFIEGGWLAGHPPPPQAKYHIGGKQYSTAAAFDKTFGYLASRDGGGQALPFADGHAFYKLALINVLQGSLASGNIIAAGAKDTSEVHMNVPGVANDTDYRFRHIIIRRGGNIIQYKKILDFRLDAGILKITIYGVWDLDLVTVGTPDTYEIGAVPYWRPAASKTSAYLVPDRGPEHYEPSKFSDEREPYRYRP